MNNALYIKAGRLLYAIAMLAIGIIDIVTHHFPAGLLPVPADLPAKTILTYVSGGTMILTATWMLVKPNSYQGSLTAVLIWLVLLVSIHLPKLLPDLQNGGEWAAALEVIAFLCGALIITGINQSGGGALLIRTGHYVFALALAGFGILHYVYLNYITTLIPGWLPAKTFLAWLVMSAFFAAALSLLLKKFVQLSMSLMSVMFIIWVFILHLPRAVNAQMETEWTSLFVALAMSGIALLVSAARNR
ncbi:MAG: hypothetical protein QM731_03265 [Chitinophagaceae bacterium]